MTPELVRVNFKARDDSALGRFWAEALGWRASSEGPGVTNLEPVGFDRPDPSAVCIDLVRVPDPETVKYRVHLELATTSEDRRAELATRLEELGATHADVGRSDAPWTVLADPEGTWNGIHLDVMSDPVEDQAREAARLEALGATRTDAGQGDVSWVVLTDLANNKYCARTGLTPRPSAPAAEDLSGRAEVQEDGLPGGVVQGVVVGDGVDAAVTPTVRPSSFSCVQPLVARRSGSTSCASLFGRIRRAPEGTADFGRSTV